MAGEAAVHAGCMRKGLRRGSPVRGRGRRDGSPAREEILTTGANAFLLGGNWCALQIPVQRRSGHNDGALRYLWGLRAPDHVAGGEDHSPLPIPTAFTVEGTVLSGAMRVIKRVRL
jgi:hypothetical protein